MGREPKRTTSNVPTSELDGITQAVSRIEKGIGSLDDGLKQTNTKVDRLSGKVEAMGGQVSSLQDRMDKSADRPHDCMSIAVIESNSAEIKDVRSKIDRDVAEGVKTRERLTAVADEAKTIRGARTQVMLALVAVVASIIGFGVLTAWKGGSELSRIHSQIENADRNFKALKTEIERRPTVEELKKYSVDGREMEQIIKRSNGKDGPSFEEWYSSLSKREKAGLRTAVKRQLPNGKR